MVRAVGDVEELVGGVSLRGMVLGWGEDAREGSLVVEWEVCRRSGRRDPSRCLVMCFSLCTCVTEVKKTYRYKRRLCLS